MYNLSQMVLRISEICSKKGISINQMLKDANLSTSLIDNMKRGRSPSIDRIYQLAEYLDCSVDYLLGRTDEPSINTGNSISEVSKSSSTDCDNGADEQEQHLLSNYKKLTEQARHTLVDYSDFVSSKPENLKDTADTDQMIS